jgi:RNA processing factor Prp31
MATEELYIEKTKNVTPEDLENDYYLKRLMVYCGLVVGSKDDKLTFEQVTEWLSECEDERYPEVISFAETSMGFIMSDAQEKTVRRINQAKQMGEMAGLDIEKLMKEEFSMKLNHSTES